MNKENRSTYIMLGAGVLSQVITFLIARDPWLSFISGLAGVFSVVLCSERKMSYYLFSFIQIITFAIICWNEHLFGKLFENAFYFITTAIGMYLWYRNLDQDDRVKTKSLDMKQKVLWGTSGIIGMILLHYMLCKMNGSFAILDSITTTLAIMAQLLMILRYKENWILWFVMDAICIVLWIMVGNWCMVAQYIFWTINTVYGYILWTKSSCTM